MKVKDIPILEKKILNMLPITQTEVWKVLGINSRDGSRIISGMVGKGLVKRTKADRTFLIEIQNENGHGDKNDIPTIKETKIDTDIKETKIDATPTPETPNENNYKKKVNTTNIKQKILDILPITQPEMWKKLGLNRRKGSRLVNTMLKEGLIKRIKVDNVFLLENAKEVSREKKKKDFSALLSNQGKFSPCSGCNIECDPRICSMLDEWLK